MGYVQNFSDLFTLHPIPRLLRYTDINFTNGSSLLGSAPFKIISDTNGVAPW